MSDRFSDLTKIPEGPAARLLADNNVKLETKLEVPVSAPVSDVLAELDEKGAVVDMLKVVAAALPPRECVWWACLAARDVPVEKPSPILTAAEAWVFKPNDENRDKLAALLSMADPDDDQQLCGSAAYYGDGSLGTGDLAEEPAPPGAVANLALGQNMISLKGRKDAMERMQFLVDRAVDIARGGNGNVTDPGAEGVPGEAGEGAAQG